jgi:hypothetical protein
MTTQRNAHIVWLLAEKTALVLTVSRLLTGTIEKTARHFCEDSNARIIVLTSPPNVRET